MPVEKSTFEWFDIKDTYMQLSTGWGSKMEGEKEQHLLSSPN